MSPATLGWDISIDERGGDGCAVGHVRAGPANDGVVGCQAAKDGNPEPVIGAELDVRDPRYSLAHDEDLADFLSLADQAGGGDGQRLGLIQHDSDSAIPAVADLPGKGG